MSQKQSEIQKDRWKWGIEKVIWGYSPEHKYTLKILEPKVGRAGCLSLQYHHEKSETWFIKRGIAWGLFIIDNKVCTRIMRENDLQNLPTGVVHCLTAISADLQVLEPSTPDKHAADKSVSKDVVRLYCVHGRDCDKPKDEIEAKLVKEAIKIIEEAVTLIDEGKIPPEYNREYLNDKGAYHID